MNFAKMIAKIDSIESASAIGEGKGDDIADKVAKKKEERDDPFSSSYKDKDEKSSGVTRVKGKSYGNHKPDEDDDGIPDYAEDGKGPNDTKKKKDKKKSKLEEADECTCTDDKEDEHCPVHGAEEEAVSEGEYTQHALPGRNPGANQFQYNFDRSINQNSDSAADLKKLAGIKTMPPVGNNRFGGLKPVQVPKGPAGPRGLNESFDQAVEEDQVDEVAAPGQEGWVKANKERFVKQYGAEKGLSTLYATAWKRHHAANESKNLEECYDQAMDQPEQETGMNISSSMDTKSGTKSLTVSAQGQAAEELAQILKLSGLLNGGASHEMEPEVVDVELDEYANEPHPITQSAEVQYNSGNDLNRRKHSQTVGAPVAIGNLAEQQKLAEIERRLMAQLNELKVVSKKALPSMSHIKKMCEKGMSVAEICKMHPDCDRAELKQMVADCKKTLDEANTESKKEFVARQARLAAAGAETAKDPERLKRMMKIPGYAAAMGLAKKADTDVKKSK